MGLLCHFCQATRSSILAPGIGGGNGNDRSGPAASVLHGLLSFLHELRSSAALGSLGVDAATIDYLLELDNALRSWQQLCLVPEGDRQQQVTTEIDGDAWTA